MGCNCGGKSQKKLSAEASAVQLQVEQARQEAVAKKQIRYAAPPPGQAPTIPEVSEA